MEQHPIPQNISSYQFRLVGDMTLKQFFQLAGGILVGLMFYSSPFLPIIKWPLAIISVILGIALAFLPFEERPLEKWIFAFFRAIYAPTIFYWQKTEPGHKYFQDEPPSSDQEKANTDKALQDYLSHTAQKETPLTNLESAEKGFLSKLTSLFSLPQATSQPTPTPTQTPEEPPKKELKVPLNEPIKIMPEFGKSRVVVEERKIDTPAGSGVTSSQVSPVIAGDEFISTRQAVFSVDAAPPNPPTSPNIVVGQVVDNTKKIIEGAIMEIKDSDGRPIRALKSNKLGHFVIVTPLDNGKYDIITDKEGYEFSPVSFEASGQIIPPILVQGKPVLVIPEEPTPIKPEQTQNYAQQI